ncbi:MAG: superoxide dismutase family protein [Hyphomicrobiaceae bacterium]
MITLVRCLVLSSSALVIATGVALSQQSLTADISRISEAGIGEKIGTVVLTSGKGGVSFKVAVTGVSKGNHGFHVHSNGDCGPGLKDGKMIAGLAAGAHYDPHGTKSHKGPSGAGHQGDLPLLEASSDGIAQTVTASRLKLADVRGRALVIHEGADNYSDQPENGGGKGRIACGVIPK